jgi:dienelactone hydrolase
MGIDRRTAIHTVARAAVGLALASRGRLLAASSADAGKGDPLDGFTRAEFVDSQRVRRVFYETKPSGPTVIVLHELPGLIPPDLAAGRRLADAGYRVVMPLFFGTAGAKSSRRRTLSYIHRYCQDTEFACGEAEKTSPHVTWLRELVTHVQSHHSTGTGVGVVGMCLTGALPIAMLQHTDVKAAVVCQPTVPFNVFTQLGLFTKKSGLGLSPDDLDAAKTKSTAPILGIRFASDPLCTNARFRRLTTEFGSRFYRMDFTGAGHSTLGQHLCEPAFQEVLGFLGRELLETPRPQTPSFPISSRPNSRDEIWVSCGHQR